MQKDGASTDSGGPRAEAKVGVALIILLGAIPTLAAVSVEAYLPALPLIARDLRAWPGGVEMTISAFLIALTIGQLVYGPLSDRIGRRPPLLAGLALYCVATVACALAVSVEQLIFFRFVQALGGCAGIVIVRAVIRDRFPPGQMVQVLSAMSVVTGLAPLLSPLLGGAILQVAPWRAILWMQLVYGAAVLIAVLLFLKESAPRPAPSAGASVLAGYAAVLRNRRVMGYAMTQGFSGSVIFIYGSALPAVAMDRYGLAAGQLSLVLAGGAFAMMAGAQFNRLLRRFQSDQVLKTANLCAIAGAVALCVMTWTDVLGLLGIMIPLTFIMVTRGIIFPHTIAQALAAEDRHVGAASAILGAQAFGWGAALSALAAALTDGTARPMAGTILLSSLLAAAALRGIAVPASAARKAQGAPK